MVILIFKNKLSFSSIIKQRSNCFKKPYFVENESLYYSHFRTSLCHRRQSFQCSGRNESNINRTEIESFNYFLIRKEEMCVFLHDILKQNCLQTNKKIKIINADPLIISITHENLLLCILTPDFNYFSRARQQVKL